MRTPEPISDDAGHIWRPQVNAAVVTQARELGIDLAALVRLRAEELVGRLVADRMRTLGQLLWLSVESQAVEQAVSPEAFARLGRGADGEWKTTEALLWAFVIALAHHFPQSTFGREMLANLAALETIG